MESLLFKYVQSYVFCNMYFIYVEAILETCEMSKWFLIHTVWCYLEVIGTKYRKNSIYFLCSDPEFRNSNTPERFPLAYLITLVHQPLK